MDVLTALTVEKIRLQVIKEGEEHAALCIAQSSVSSHSIKKVALTASFEVTLPSGQVTRLVSAALAEMARAIVLIARAKTIVAMPRDSKTAGRL